MGSNNEFKEIDNKNGACYYFNDRIDSNDIDLDNDIQCDIDNDIE